MGGLRVATWNLNHRGRAVAPTLGELVRRAEVDVVLLQEANIGGLDAFRKAAGLDWAFPAFDAGAPPIVGRSGRTRVAAVAGRGDPPREVGMLTHLSLPERMVFATVSTTVGDLTV